MILPIRGKVRNAFKCSREAFFANEEVQGITRIILGKEGYHRNFNVEDCKVEKVIFMADADQQSRSKDTFRVTTRVTI